MDCSGFVFDDPNHLRIADCRHSCGRSLWRLADGDRLQGNVRSCPGCRSTMSAHFAV